MLHPFLETVVDLALREDLSSGDLASMACVDPTTDAEASAVARTELVVCGGEVFACVFRRVDPRCQVEAVAAEGALACAGDTLWRVNGPAQSVLMAERTALNFVQRMSGIATTTRQYVKALPDQSTTRIADTRKTTPGLRFLERYAVRTGGGHNHRDNLGSAVMIKDNHVLAAGGITRAVERARSFAPHTSRIEVEVGSLEEFDEAVRVGADIIMLDNFQTTAIVEACERVRSVQGRARPILEVSGGITLSRIPELATLGVDVISVGALTHSSKAADIALDFLE